MTRCALLLTLLSGCGEPEPATVPAPAAPEAWEPMDAGRLLTRMSLDLRGVRPTPAELDRVEADPEALEELLDELLADPRLEARVADLFAEVFLTRTEDFGVSFEAYDLEGFTYADVLRSVGDEPLRMIGRIAATDRPITDLVTADWTMADERLARIWPLDYPEGQTGWREARYTDGRPAAGVLTSNALWWRYQSTDSNANRKRANTASRILLCHDYLTRPIEFDRNVNLLDEEAVEDALSTNPGCVNCHASLDPLAAYFFGFWWYETSSSEVARYHPSRERNWETALGTPPSYYGEPGSSLADLGRQIAADNRFPECMVEHVTELLLRREAGLLDADRMTAHREALLAGGLRLRPLLKSVLSSPEYQAESDAGLPGTQAPTKLVSPTLLGSQVEDLTGFRWRSLEGYDLLLTDSVGFLTLAGGADGVYATRDATSPNPTLLLVQERLAEAAADHVVNADAAVIPSERRLFGLVSFQETPDTDRAAMVAQIQHLHRRVFGRAIAANGEEVEANLGLWSELYALDADPLTAWSGLLSALLRDPDFLFY